MSRAPTSLTRAIAWFSSSYGVAILGYLALNAIAARLLGRDDLGAFVIFLTATSVIGQVGLLGAHRAGLREAARTTQADVESLGQLRGGVRAVQALTLPASAVVTGAVTYVLVDRPGLERLGLAAVVGVLVLVSGQQKLVANYLRGLGYVRLSGLIEGRSGGAAVAVLQALLLLALLLLAPTSGLVPALVAAAIGFLVPVGAGLVVLHRHWRHAPATRLLPSVRLVARRDWRFALNQVGGQTNAALDVWVCGLLLSPATTSLFAAAQRLAQLLQTPTTALQVVFAPAISRLAGAGDTGRLERLVRTGSLLGTAVVGVSWATLALAPAWWMGLVFGETFRSGATVLLLLATGYLINAVSGMSGITLSMSHHEGYVARAQWAVVVVRGLLGAAAAWQYGLVGIALTSLACTVGFYAVVWVGARRRVGVSTHLTVRPDLRLLRTTSG